jgi:acyl-CoA thioesterase-1
MSMSCRSLAGLVLASCIVLAPATTPAADAAAAGAPRIVCLGDSLTEGYGLAPEQAWPTLIQESLRREGWPQAEVVNAGVSGSTSASAVSRLKWQLRRKPDVLVLALGANDGLRGIAPDETRKNLAAAIDLAQTSGIVVLLAGMKMPPNYGPEYTKQFEGTFTALAIEKNVALIPFLLDGVAADPAFNLPDGIHPNAKGYEIVARTVTGYLRPLLERRAAAPSAVR